MPDQHDQPDPMDRRTTERLTFARSLSIRLGSPERSWTVAPAEALDLSTTGMSFRTSLRLAVGDEVQIHISDVFEGSAITARVRYVAPDTSTGGYVVGVEHAARGATRP